MRGDGAAESRARIRVLIVDDDPALLETVTAILEAHFDAKACGSGPEALALLRREAYDVIVADWKMPGMTGLEIFQQASKLGSNAACLLMTGHMEAFTGEVTPDQRRRLGFLRKPVQPPELVRRIEAMAQIASLRESAKQLVRKLDGG